MGRHREFDVEQALDAALCVFWRKGYEGASYTDLTQATGVERPARPRCHVETILNAETAALDPGPGDHRRIVGAKPQRRRDEGQVMGGGQVFERGADGQYVECGLR